MTDLVGDGDLQRKPGQTLVVPMFPLPSTVLFPRVKMPFYVFEPRYQAMLLHALDTEGLLGIPLLQPPYEDDHHGRPRISTIFGVGSIEDYETHDDGTSNIDVLGRWRVRLVEEIEHQPFRLARVEILAEETPAGDDVVVLRARLERALSSLERIGLRSEAKEALSRLFSEASTDITFLVHMLTLIIVGHPAVRQNLLEEGRVVDRANHLVTLLETLRQELGGPSGGTST